MFIYDICYYLSKKYIVDTSKCSDKYGITAMLVSNKILKTTYFELFNYSLLKYYILDGYELS